MVDIKPNYQQVIVRPKYALAGPPGKDGGGTGTNDHATALNRDLPDQHPQSAITALVTDLLAIVAAIQGLTDGKEDEGVAAGLITDLINTSDPFVQYLLESEANTVISENTDVAASKAHREITSGNPHGATHSDLPDKGTNDHAVIDTALTALADLLDRTTGENTGDENLDPYALIETVLLKGNTDDPVFVPALDNDPANKKFVEDYAATIPPVDSLDTDQISVPDSRIIGTPTETLTLDKIIDYIASAGLFSGVTWTNLENGSAIIGAGEGWLRATDSETAPIIWLSFPETEIELIDGFINFVYVDYSAGVPEVKKTSNINDFNCLDKCILYVSSRVGNDVHRIGAFANNVDAGRKIRRKAMDLEGKIVVPGTALTANAGTRHIKVSAGRFWFILSNPSTPAFDTSGTGTFSLFYGSGTSWSETQDNTQVSNLLYNDGSITPATLGTGKSTAYFVFISLDDDTPHLSVVASGSFKNPEEAMTAEIPGVLPVELGGMGVYLSTVIIEQGAAEIHTILLYSSGGGSQGVVQVAHNGLPGLQGGNADERIHLDMSQYDGLINGFRGNLTTAERDALPDPILGNYVFNTEFRLRKETCQGDGVWVPDKYGWAERLEDYWEPHDFLVDGATGPDGWSYEVVGSPTGVNAEITATGIFLEAVIAPGSAVIVKKTFDLSPLLITQIAEIRASYRMQSTHNDGAIDGGIAFGVEIVSGTDYVRAVYETGDFEYVGIQKHIGNEGEVRTMVPENWISGSGFIETFSTLSCDSGDGILLTFGEAGEGQNGEVNKDSSYRWVDGPTSVDLVFKIYAEPDVVTSVRELSVIIDQITFKAAI